MYSRVSLEVILFLLFFFFGPLDFFFLVIGFTLGLQAIQSLDIGHKSSISNGFHLMERTGSQTRHCYSFQFGATIALAFFVGGDRLQIKGLWLCWCLYFSSRSLKSNFPYERDKDIGMRVLYKHQLTLSIINALCGCCLQQWDPTVSLQRVIYCFDNSKVV